MTIQAIVIPKFQNSLWHITALSYCHSSSPSYTYSRDSYTPLLFVIDFSSFLDTKLAGYLFQAIFAYWLRWLSRFKSNFCQILARTESDWVERFSLFLTEFSRVFAEFVIPGPWIVCVDRLLVDLVQNFSKPSFGISNF